MHCLRFTLRRALRREVFLIGCGESETSAGALAGDKEWRECGGGAAPLGAVLGSGSGGWI